LDDPEVIPRYGQLEAASNHRMLRFLDSIEPRHRHDGHSFVVGPFGVCISERQAIDDRGPPPPGLAVRFGQCLGKLSTKSAQANDPLHGELVRVLDAMRSTDGHVRALGADAQQWCAAMVRAHVTALSSTLVPGWIEYEHDLARCV